MSASRLSNCTASQPACAASLTRQEALARSAQITPHAKLVLDMAGDRAAMMWAESTLSRRRAVLSTLLESVRILPVFRRGPGFDPRTVEIIWRQSSNDMSHS